MFSPLQIVPLHNPYLTLGIPHSLKTISQKALQLIAI